MICITKPLSSRPANSERYLVCKGLREEHPASLIDTLLKVNEYFERKINVTSLVPAPILESDESFVEYVKMQNMRLATKQIDALEQLERYTRDPSQRPTYDHEWVRQTCLKEWHLPL
ncbi:hypothetical protein BX666DRAFT_1890671 [Dichotomocladium elegans]|nr:hypothetical protein BX666DRAFT_1890671 [Dichotomocladium elegans]